MSDDRRGPRCGRRAGGRGSRPGGERGGLPIEGFDLGNSPAEFMPQAVGGKTVVLTTTNGTKALLQCTERASKSWSARS